ncbi:MAG: hypothetical protein ACXWRU_07115 [Pseudobdellovibrionaceae bacterium]
MRNLITQSKFYHWLPLIALLLFTILRIYLFLGNFDIQLSRTTYDAGPVSMGHYMHSPQNFLHDIEMNLSYRQWLPSLLFSLTVVLDLIFKIQPETSGLIFVYLQNILIVVAMYILTLRITKNRLLACIIGLYVLWFTPQFFNLSYYGELLWMPYAGHLALPFFIFSFSLLLTNRWVLALVSLLIGGLIHVTLGLQAAFILGVYWVLRNFSFKTGLQLEKNFRLQLSWLFAIVLSFIVVSKVFILGIKPIDSVQIYDFVSGVMHQVPWLGGWEPFNEKILAVITKLLLAVLAIFAFPQEFSSETKTLWQSIIISTFLLSFSNILGFWIHSSTLLQLTGLRSSTFLILFSLPLIFSSLFPLDLPKITNKKVAAILTLFSLSGVTLAHFLEQNSWELKIKVLSILLAVFLLIYIFIAEKSVPFFYFLIGVALHFSLMEASHSLRYFWPDIHISISGASLICAILLVASVIYAFSIKKNILSTITMTIAAAIFACNALATAEDHGKTTTTGHWAQIYSAQLWARDFTPPGSHFILMDLLSNFQSWRTLTRRGLVTETLPFGNQYFYSQALMDYADELNRFYGNPLPKKYFIFDQDHENIIRKRMSDNFRNLSDARILEFAKKFGGDFIVRKADQRKLTFPVAYQNDYIIIYSLK